MKITADLLRKHNACADQVALFERTFPGGADPVTDWQTAIDAGLDVTWCERLLSAPALAEYERVRGQAWAEYQRVRGPALASALAAEGEER